MAAFKRENYITIQGFMITDLKLYDTELLVYAIIYGFSQTTDTDFRGSISYLETATNKSRRTIINVINSLVEKGYIYRISEIGKVNNYGIVFSKIDQCRSCTSAEVAPPPVQMLHQDQCKTCTPTSANVAPYNTIDNNKDKTNNITRQFFANEELNNAYLEFMQMRKEIKHKVTPTAIKQHVSLLNKYDTSTAIAMLNQSITNNYQGIFEVKGSKFMKPQARDKKPCSILYVDTDLEDLELGDIGDINV